jgi:uncharacterized membrane protein
VASEGDEVEASGGADARTLALSDGVFAIALTLLVLSLHSPADLDHPTASQLWDALWDQSGAFAAWLLSFYVIGVNWLRHRRVFRHVAEPDDPTVRLNLVYLAAVSFLPFPTDVIASYGSEWPAVALYSGSIAFSSTLLGLITARNKVPGHSRVWWLVPVIMLATIPLSLLIGSAALFLLFLMRIIPDERG